MFKILLSAVACFSLSFAIAQKTPEENSAKTLARQISKAINANYEVAFNNTTAQLILFELRVNENRELEGVSVSCKDPLLRKVLMKEDFKSYAVDWNDLVPQKDKAGFSQKPLTVWVPVMISQEGSSEIPKADVATLFRSKFENGGGTVSLQNLLLTDLIEVTVVMNKKSTARAQY